MYVAFAGPDERVERLRRRNAHATAISASGNAIDDRCWSLARQSSSCLVSCASRVCLTESECSAFRACGRAFCASDLRVRERCDCVLFPSFHSRVLFRLSYDKPSLYTPTKHASHTPTPPPEHPLDLRAELHFHDWISSTSSSCSSKSAVCITPAPGTEDCGGSTSSSPSCVPSSLSS